MILVTGGAGFIGSHTCVALAAAGMRIVVSTFVSVMPRVWRKHASECWIVDSGLEG